MTYIVTQFKETVAFEDLQRIIGNEIAGAFLARLKEFSVPDDRLRQVSEDICYDIASAMSTVGDYEIPGADKSCGVEEEKTDRVDWQQESGTGDLASGEDKTDRVDQQAPGVDDLTFMEEKTDGIEQQAPGMDEPAFMEETTDEFELPELSADDMAFLEEKTDEINTMDVDSDNEPSRPVAGVLSQSEILKILDSAKTVS